MCISLMSILTIAGVAFLVGAIVPFVLVFGLMARVDNR